MGTDRLTCQAAHLVDMWNPQLKKSERPEIKNERLVSPKSRSKVVLFVLYSVGGRQPWMPSNEQKMN